MRFVSLQRGNLHWANEYRARAPPLANRREGLTVRHGSLPTGEQLSNVLPGMGTMPRPFLAVIGTQQRVALVRAGGFQHGLGCEALHRYRSTLNSLTECPRPSITHLGDDRPPMRTSPR